MAEVKIQAPNESGTFTYEFRFGTESLGLFGAPFKMTINVLKDESIFEKIARDNKNWLFKLNHLDYHYYHHSIQPFKYSEMMHFYLY